VDVWLLRHGESVNNTLPRAEHRPDPELTEVGRRQAAELAAAVAPLRPHAVVSSPLIRAMETARPLVAAAGVPWLVWADLAEAHRAHPGDGLPLEALRRRFPGAEFEPGMPWPGYPGEETPQQAAARAARVWTRLRALAEGFGPGARVAVVGHTGLHAYIVRECLGAPHDGSVEVVQDNAFLHHLVLEPGGGVRLVRCNVSPRLLADG
jgi:broad specificity phosphatase PhoE